MTRRSSAILVVLGMMMALIPTTVVLAAGPGTTINEIRIDQPSSDTDEYFELFGDPGAGLEGLTYLVIGDGAAALGSGVIEAVVDLSDQSLDSSGFFVAAEGSFTLGTPDLVTSLNFENGDNVTHVLVEGFDGFNGQDLDTDDDGTLDVAPWMSIVDSVSLVQTFDFDDGERIYGDATVGPDGAFVPGHAYDCDVYGWLIGGFGPLGRTDSPGAANDCDPDEVAIHDVQGSGGSSPLGGLLVTVTGVVVGDFQESDELGGFFLQEEDTQRDDDDETSEGVFIATTTTVAVGDVVAVTGLVGEPFNRTEIDGFDVSVVGSGATVTPSEVSLPVTSLFDLERFEGMLVTFPQDLFISEYFNFDRFNEIVLTTERQYQGTHVAAPGDPANAVTAENALARITLDDGRSSQNPDPAIHPNGAEFTLTNTFRGGDILQDVTGVIDFAFGLYRIQPVHLDDPLPSVTYVNANPRPSSPDPIEGEVRVASFNVLNFFTHLDDGVSDFCGPTGDLECRGADTQEELDRQLAKLVAGVIALDADIVGIQEIENDILESDGDRAHDAVLTLVEALNALPGAGTWAWVGEANHYNDYPVRNEIIYRTADVEVVGDPIALADDAFDDTRPGDVEPLGRPPLAQTFRQIVDRGSRQPFTVVVNHFKSKGSDCASIGDPDIGDGQAHCNLTRVAQSEALLDFIDGLEAETSGVLVIGDLNSYAMEDPITALVEGGLTELVETFIGADAYSFVFDGQLGYLDTALATRSMLNRVRGVTIFHINADEPDILDYDMSFKQDAQDDLFEAEPYRVSDHDPVIVGLTFGGSARRGG